MLVVSITVSTIESAAAVVVVVARGLDESPVFLPVPYRFLYRTSFPSANSMRSGRPLSLLTHHFRGFFGFLVSCLARGLSAW